jgi:hypothetical protein
MAAALRADGFEGEVKVLTSAQGHWATPRLCSAASPFEVFVL